MSLENDNLPKKAASGFDSKNAPRCPKPQPGSRHARIAAKMETVEMVFIRQRTMPTKVSSHARKPPTTQILMQTAGQTVKRRRLSEDCPQLVCKKGKQQENVEPAIQVVQAKIVFIAKRK